MSPHTEKTSQAQPALGKAIRTLRREQGKSQVALSSDAGVTTNMLSLIERGQGNPTWSTVRGIAEALGMTVAELAQIAEAQEP